MFLVTTTDDRGRESFRLRSTQDEADALGGEVREVHGRELVGLLEMRDAHHEARMESHREQHPWT